MKKVGSRGNEVTLQTFEASSMELVALGSAILHYSRYIQWLRCTEQRVTFEQEQVARLLDNFYSRLVEQLDIGLVLRKRD